MVGAVAVLRPVGHGVSDFQPMAFFVVLVHISVLIIVVVAVAVISQKHLQGIQTSMLSFRGSISRSRP